jgi:hypothetical protein
MQRIVIKYSISRTAALVEGRAEYGEATYQPTDTELAFLSLDDRKYLDTLNLDRDTFALPTGAPPTWPNIADSIKADRQARLDKQVAELAQREVNILECLAEPDDKWFSERTDWHGGVNRKSVSVRPPTYEVNSYSWGTQDERILARIESLKPELERRQAVANEANEQANEANEQAKANHEAAEQRKLQASEEATTAKQAAVTNVTKWCIEHGPDHLKRAASEDYDVAGGCVQWLAEQLRSNTPDPAHCTIIRDRTKLWDRYNWEERKSPGAKAFEVLDAATTAVKELAHPASVTIEVERILLVEVEPPEDECDDPKREFTAVVVDITHPATARRCLVIEVK